MLSTIVQLVIGLAALLFGRRLYWLFVALAGFLFGLLLGQALLGGQPEIVRFFLALVIGAGMAAVALFIQRPIVALGGFFALGSFGALLANMMGMSGLWWVFFLIGGVIGAVLVFQFFDWALIINSSLSGAGAVAAAAASLVPALGGWVETLLLVALAVAGIVFQARDVRGG